MTEGQFWRDMLRPKLQNVRPIVLYRLENSVASGMPDVNAAFKGVERWLELKIMHGCRITVRFSQLRWLKQRERAQCISSTKFVVWDDPYIKVFGGDSVLFASTKSDCTESDDSMTVPIGAPDFLIHNADPRSGMHLIDYLFHQMNGI